MSGTRFAFICGCGHSGTSLLAAMFAAHPDVYVPLAETRIFLRPLPVLRVAGLRLQALLRGRKHLVEKTPRHVEKIALIRATIPGARFILMVRDGRDVAASIFKRIADLDAAVERWTASNSIVRDLAGAPDCAIVRYEDLIEDPEGQLRRLCAQIGIPFAAEMLDYHKQPRQWFGTRTLRQGDAATGAGHNELRNWQINQPIFDGRGKWKSVLGEAAPPALESGKGGELMRHFGYL